MKWKHLQNQFLSLSFVLFCLGHDKKKKMKNEDGPQTTKRVLNYFVFSLIHFMHQHLRNQAQTITAMLVLFAVTKHFANTNLESKGNNTNKYYKREGEK